MGPIYKHFLDSESTQSTTRIFTCSECKTHFSTFDSIISKAFQGQYGRAYLFNNVVNVFTGDPVGKDFSLSYRSSDDYWFAYCQRLVLYCLSVYVLIILTIANVGWKYDRAYEESQRYKEGKFILEKQLINENTS